METRTYKVYKIDELPKEAREKAIEKWREDMDYPFLEEMVQEELEELLKDNNIKGDPTVQYSFSYCQGDGAMFYGSFEWNNIIINIKHSGHYYHAYCKTVDYDYSQLPKEPTEKQQEKLEAEFEQIYIDICEKLEKYGYNIIKEEDKEENIIETMRINDYDFTLNGDID